MNEKNTMSENDDVFQIAKVILNDFVNTTDLEKSFRKEYLEQNAFLRKCRIYKTAVVLIVFIIEEKNKKDILKLREAFEYLVFGKLKEDSLKLVNEVNLAMKDLRDLMFPADSKNNMSLTRNWAKNWFHKVSIDENNPVYLVALCHYFMSGYITLSKSCRGQNT